jgi:hypothetical protein
VTLCCYEVKTFFHLENQLDMAPNFGEVVTGMLVCLVSYVYLYYRLSMVSVSDG